jgi:hypothetical protein
MRFTSLLRLRARAVLAALVFLAGVTEALGFDTYNAGTKQLSAPTVTIGGATFNNVVLTVASIVTPPSGSSPNGTSDSYNPVNNDLTIPAVKLGSTMYFNVVVKVAALGSISSVSGADAYGGTDLSVPAVQVGNTIFTTVVLAISAGNITGIGGGMPAALQDSFSTSTGVLNVPAVSAFGHVYTNVTLNITLADVVSHGGQHAAPISVLSTGFNSNMTTTTSGSSDGSFTAYFSGSDPTLAGSTGGYYADQQNNPSAEYAVVNDTLANLGTSVSEGVGIKPALDQTISTAGSNYLSFTVAINKNWFDAGADFVVLISGDVAGVSNESCNPQVAAVVAATASSAVPYSIPLTAFNHVTQTCGDSSIKPAQILAAPVAGVDFQADGLGAAITASGLTSNINTTVAAVGTYPASYGTSITVLGELNFTP